MGMAASQARFLGLTARKSNIEYQGQQINEQRTSLANQSANFYNQMLTLKVPVPPSSGDYSKITYTFTIPSSSDTGTVSQITPITSGTYAGMYTVAYSYSSEDWGFSACSFNNREAIDIDTSTTPSTYKAIVSGEQKNLTLYDDSDPTMKSLHGDAYTALITDPAADSLYFVNAGTEAAPTYQYFKQSDLDYSQTSESDGKSVYYTSGTIKQYHTDALSPCDITRDSSGRLESIIYKGTSLSVTTTTTEDSEAYDDAYNQYTYENYLYEQEMNNINAKTEVIQVQDKNLELQLKRIDTEHQAIQTEMDAVSAVIKKNSEDSFKTFA